MKPFSAGSQKTGSARTRARSSTASPMRTPILGSGRRSPAENTPYGRLAVPNSESGGRSSQVIGGWSGVTAVEVPHGLADVELPRPGDLLLGVRRALLPLGQPAGHPADREQHLEH